MYYNMVIFDTTKNLYIYRLIMLSGSFELLGQLDLFISSQIIIIIIYSSSDTNDMIQREAFRFSQSFYGHMTSPVMIIIITSHHRRSSLDPAEEFAFINLLKQSSSQEQTRALPLNVRYFSLCQTTKTSIFRLIILRLAANNC